MDVSAPVIDEPLYLCTSKVVLRGLLPGSIVHIYAIIPGNSETLQIGQGESRHTVQIFNVDRSKLTREGTKIYSTQVWGEVPSSTPPRHATLQSPLIGIPAPRFANPVFECSHCLRVENILPGAIVQLI